MGVLIPTASKNAEWHGSGSITVSRTSGVAPLSVFFDAEDLGAKFSDNPFHDLEYRWDFGDTANPTATWAYGSNHGVNKKNEATGPVSAHVYETPGVYTVSVSIWDGNTGDRMTLTQAITVTDPDVVFADTTYVVSTDGDFTGAPSGATELISSVFDTALSTALTAGAKRVLFKADQTFTFNSSTYISETGPMLIGSFGSGAKPILSLDSSYSGYYCMYAVTDDFRAMDFEIAGNGYTDPYAVRAVALFGENNLALRIYGHDIGWLAAPAGSNNAIVECETDNIVGGGGNVPIYANNAHGLFIAGCRFDNDGGGEHCVRYQSGTKGVISNNTFRRCASTKHLLTIRGVDSYTSGRHVVSDNFFDGVGTLSSPQMCTIAPTNTTLYEPIADVIWERNLSIAGASSTTHVVIVASNITVRNNLIDHSLGGGGRVIQISYGSNTMGIPTPTGNCVYNNTIYSSSANDLTGVGIMNFGLQVEYTTVKNNFVYAPNTTGSDMYEDYGLYSVISSNTENSSVSSEISDTFTHFTVQPPTYDPEDWGLTSGSYAKGSGESVPVLSDFLRNPLYNTSTRNLGAVEG